MNKKKDNLITLSGYLSTYNRQRNLDKVITSWYVKKYNDNKKRSIVDWESIIQSFFNETE